MEIDDYFKFRKIAEKAKLEKKIAQTCGCEQCLDPNKGGIYCLICQDDKLTELELAHFPEQLRNDLKELNKLFRDQMLSEQINNL